MTWISRLRVRLRQRRHHRAFRIARPVWNAAERERLTELLASPPAAQRDAVAPTDHGLDEKALATAATSLWRARKKLARSGEANAKANRQVDRYLVAGKEAFDAAGLLIQDHDGIAFNAGLSLEVLSFQEDPALASEVVLDTVKPSIYLGDRRIQMGQVIVGSPAPANTSPVEDSRA